MWESDKQALNAYKTCFDGVLDELKNGEEVDLSEMCKTETKNL